jgi:hypothetical protein
MTYLNLGDHNLQLQSKDEDKTKPDNAEYSLEGLLTESPVIGPLCP